MPGVEGMPGYNGTDGIPGLPGEPGAHGKRGKRGQLLYTQKNMHMNEYSQKDPLKRRCLPFKPPGNLAAFYGFYHPLRKRRGEFYPASVTQQDSERLWDLPLNKAELMITADWLLCSESTRAYRHSRSAIQQINYIETEWNSLYRGGEITGKHLNTFYDDSIL